jgi:hypothetical protein
VHVEGEGEDGGRRHTGSGRSGDDGGGSAVAAVQPVTFGSPEGDDGPLRAGGRDSHRGGGSDGEGRDGGGDGGGSGGGGPGRG